MSMECETTIRGGFPLRVRFRMCPAEPDVGIMSAYAEIDEILTPAGKSAEFLNFTDKELDEIAEACDAYAFDVAYNNYEEDYRW